MIIEKKIKSPQIKICGLTRPDEAIGCAQAGADAIGLVFYQKSPRYVTRDQAKKIINQLPANIKSVGVFVNETFSYIMQRIEHCSLNAVQLHGNEKPEFARRLARENITVIKVLFDNKAPYLKDAGQYEADAFLVECGKGILPGGNAMAWNWANAKLLGERYPIILAGGLDPDNVKTAFSACLPDAFDISSGVERSPGRKDLSKVRAFIRAVNDCDLKKTEQEKKLSIF